MSSGYRSRRQQIRADFYRLILEALERQCVTPDTNTRRVILEQLKLAALVGGCEERHRALVLLAEPSMSAGEIIKTLTEKSVLEVLGYTPRQARARGQRKAPTRRTA